MEEVWSTSRCIICGSGQYITKEHIVPACLGGKLVAKFLCNTCNSTLGRRAESSVRKDPAIRVLIERLVLKRPDLADQLRKGLPYVLRSGLGDFPGYWRDGEFTVKERLLDDGSLIAPANVGLRHAKNMADRNDEKLFHVSVHELNGLPSGKSLEVSPEIVITNWVVEAARPDLDGPAIDPIVPAKMAFEYLALHCRDAIYDNPPQLASIRRQLLAGALHEGNIDVERLNAQNNRLFHGLAFEGNNPGAQVQIRLLGSLAFRVQFRSLSVNGTRYGYTHDLVSGDEGGWVAATE